MIASKSLLLLIIELALMLSAAMATDELELSAASHPIDSSKEMLFRPQYSEPYIIITPASGTAPLVVTLQVKGMEQTSFWFWELDWDGDGQKDTIGHGLPFQEVTYSFPGDYFPVFSFYNDQNELITQAGGSITVSGQSSNGAGDTASQSQGLTAAPGGWGIVKDTQSSVGKRPAEDLSNATDSWSPPSEEFTEYLKPQLYASIESGLAPLKVDFDASRTYSRYGVLQFNYDVIWGPHEAEDDGYYLYSGNSPQWTHTFDEYGMYLVILDVEDNSGKRARVTKVIFVL
jgi:hypothetical protein